VSVELAVELTVELAVTVTKKPASDGRAVYRPPLSLSFFSRRTP
jgi:hypothetical protein